MEVYLELQRDRCCIDCFVEENFKLVMENLYLQQQQNETIE